MFNHFDYINNFTPGQMAVKMSVRRPINADPVKGINGDQFAKEMEFLAANGVQEVIIDINSKGGNIKEGFSIYQSIKDYPGKTTTRVIGIAASMAGMISQAGDERVILDYGLFHTHGPQAPAGKKADAALIDIMRGSLKTILKSKADITDEKAEKLLNSENLFTAVEALNLGFFDRIESTQSSIKLDLSNSLDEIYEMANNFINTKTNKMEKVVSFLGLENSANEEAVIKSLEELKNNAEKVLTLENEVTEKTEKVNELTESLEAQALEVTDLINQVTELKTAAAEALINEAVKSGKLQKESTAKWLEMAKNDINSTKELLSGLGTSPKAEAIENEFIADESENRKEWDFQQWSQDAPKDLEKMKNENPSKFEELLNDYIK